MPEADYSKEFRPPWGVIAVCFALGLVFLGLGNLDRMFWRLTSAGEPVPGRVVEMRSHRTSPRDTYLTFTPRVQFTDPGGAQREMSVKSGSTHYNFRKGEPVTVLWRAEDQSIAIALPFQRKFGMAILMWVLTAAGAGMVLLGLWFMFRRWVLKRKGVL